MPNLMRATQRALEIVAARHARYQEDLQQQQQEAAAQGASQRQKRAAYEAAAGAAPGAYAAARAAYEAQYGPEEWGRQETLGLRRDRRAQEQQEA